MVAAAWAASSASIAWSRRISVATSAARSANVAAGSSGPYSSVAACAAAAHCAARGWPWWPRDAALISAVSWAGPAASSARGSA